MATLSARVPFATFRACAARCRPCPKITGGWTHALSRRSNTPADDFGGDGHHDGGRSACHAATNRRGGCGHTDASHLDRPGWRGIAGPCDPGDGIPALGHHIDQGDSITWTANSAEPHTVTFLTDQTATTPPPFTPATDLTPTPDPVYHSGIYYNSGLLANLSPGLPTSTSYSSPSPTRAPPPTSAWSKER